MDQSQMVAAGTAIGAIFGAMAAFLTAWMRGRNDLAKVVDERIKMMLDRDAQTIAEKNAELAQMRADLDKLMADYGALKEEHKNCNDKIAMMEQEIAELRAQLHDISEPQDHA